MTKVKFFALFCAVLLLFTGCAPEPKDDFADYEWVEPAAVEGVTAQTELAEYNGNIEGIDVIVTNDLDERFFYGDSFTLQKSDNGSWRSIKTGGICKDYSAAILPRSLGCISVNLKDHVKLPLLSGHYRIWIGTYEQVSAEFDIK